MLHAQHLSWDFQNLFHLPSVESWGPLLFPFITSSPLAAAAAAADISSSLESLIEAIWAMLNYQRRDLLQYIAVYSGGISFPIYMAPDKRSFEMIGIL